MKTYQVTITAKYPAAYERPGVIEIQATNASDAIKKARRQTWNDGAFDRHDGPMTYRAKVLQDECQSNPTPTWVNPWA
jgi:hypothetical protein